MTDNPKRRLATPPTAEDKRRARDELSTLCPECGAQLLGDVLDKYQHDPSCPRRVRGPAELLLDELVATVTAYVVWPSAEAADAFALWIVATHAQSSWEHATRFVVKSPIKRCGKTRVAEVARELAHRALAASNASTAAIARSIVEDDPPTLIIDEADTIFGRKKDAREGSEDLRGILNAGHGRGFPYLRWDAKARELEACPTFAMALVAGIGNLPDTIEDRAVVVPMRRRAPGESVEPWRRRRTVPELHDLRGRVGAWIAGETHQLDGAEPDLPVEDRDADVWEPLVAIAELAGGAWQERARRACRVICAARPMDDGTLGERLLGDLRDVWPSDEHVPTSTLLDLLRGIEDAPWATLYGRELTARDLAQLLRPYGVRPANIAIGNTRPKGYTRADLLDPWTRYLPEPGDADDPARRTAPAPAATPLADRETPGLTCENGGSGRVADDAETSATGPEKGERTPRSAVADGSDVQGRASLTRPAPSGRVPS